MSLIATAALLAACGGGGDEAEAPKGPYFAVEGTKTAGGLSFTACIDGIEYLDPVSAKGQQIAANLARYYSLVGSYRSFSGTGQSCRDRFATLSAVLSVDEYNATVLPAVSTMPPPAPAPTPSPTPSPSPSPSPAPAPSPSPSPAPSPSPSPSPAPAPITPRSCTATSGPGVDGLQLFGQASYTGLSGIASTNGSVTLDPGEVSFNNASLGASSTTGSLRATLRAFAGNYNGGSISSPIVARTQIRFTDGTSQLRNGESSNLSAQTLSATTPPRGSYCMVVTLDEYDPASCPSSTDGYCIVDWQQFSTPAQFE